MPEGDSKSASLNRTYCYPNSTDGHEINHVRVTTIARPDQGPGLEPGPPVWEASTLEKSHLDSLYAGYSEPLLMMSLLHPDLYNIKIYLYSKMRSALLL
jgi:hypothetical protein